MIESRHTRSEGGPPLPTLTQALGGRCSTLTDCVGMGAIVAGAWVQPVSVNLVLTWQHLVANGLVGFAFGAALPALAYLCAVRIRPWWWSLLPVTACAGLLSFLCWQAFASAWGFSWFLDLLCSGLVLVVPLIDWGLARSRAWCGRRTGDSTGKL